METRTSGSGGGSQKRASRKAGATLARPHQVKIRDGVVTNRPVYLALGVTVDGVRDILGLWAGEHGDGAKYWLRVLSEIKNRGVRGVFFLVCDGLRGLPEVVGAVREKTIVQTSSVDTSWRRDGPAGHRAAQRGLIQARAFEANSVEQALHPVAGGGGPRTGQRE